MATGGRGEGLGGVQVGLSRRLNHARVDRVPLEYTSHAEGTAVSPGMWSDWGHWGPPVQKKAEEPMKNSPTAGHWVVCGWQRAEGRVVGGAGGCHVSGAQSLNSWSPKALSRRPIKTKSVIIDSGKWA